jgi:peptide/nickel transport system substrate-binding protein
MNYRFLRVLLLAIPLVAANEPKELRFTIAGDPLTFDPLQVSESNSETIRYLTAGVLVRVNRATDQLEPELAESWQTTEGGRALTFHLRAGLKFSDGSPLTAADVGRTVTRALDPKEASPAGDTIRTAEGNPEIRIASAQDITLRYKSPRQGLDRLFDSIGIAPAPSPRAQRSFAPSAGPFFVAEYRHGISVRLQRNPHYWKRDAQGQRLPAIESVRLDIQQNHDLVLARFMRGELQMINRLDAESFDRVSKEKPAAARNLGASLDSEFLWFNQSPARSVPEYKRKWFTSNVFRHAVSRAIHRDDIVRIAYRGHAHVAAGPISTANAFWFNASLKPLASDPQQALKMLLADGFTFRDSALRDRTGHAVEFSLITNSLNRSRENIGRLVQDDLKKIGIRVNFVPLEMNSLLERISKSLDYEACLMGFANVDPDPLVEKNIWLSSGAQHPWWPAQKSPATAWEARIDELELKQAAEGSRPARKKASDEIQQIVVAEEPIIYLVNPDYLCAIAPSLQGVKPAVAPPQVLWNIEWLHLE